MKPINHDDATPSLEKYGLLMLLVAATVGLIWILLPYFGAILWGAIIALLFGPLQRHLLQRMRGRHTLAALLTLLIVLLMVILPLALITTALAREAALLYQRMQSGGANPVVYLQGMFEALPESVTKLLDRIGLDNFADLQLRLTAALAQGSEFIATQVFNVGQNTFGFFISLAITLYLAFFMIRDGSQIVKSVGRVIPLSSPHKRELFTMLTTVIRATVKGNLLIAVIQGALGGLAFWFLDVRGALLWAVLMAFLSLLPAVGAGLVWLPVAIYFFLTGSVGQGIALTTYGVLVIGLVDNLLRPMLVGKDTRMPDYVVMISTLGGMTVFGINGFVLGPGVAALFIAVWHLYGTTKAGTNQP